MGLNRAYTKATRKKDGSPSKGTFLLTNPDKYIGHLPVSYRSSWEFAFCRFCDMNLNVVKWSSEGLEIQYKITNDIGQIETHRYYPDFYVEMTTNDPEKYERLLIEIKPKHETELPIPQKKQTLKILENYEYALRQYKKNLQKWAFTKDWCEKRNIKFVIITELDLKKRGLIP